MTERSCNNCRHRLAEDPCLCLDCDPETLNAFQPDRDALKTVIRNHMDEEDFWVQLAEEATELAQAAIKMQRIIRGKNPPRKTMDECINDVIEEHADLALCFEMLDWHDSCRRGRVQEEKLPRWAGTWGE